MVPFAGDGLGVGDLTWSQRNIWRMMEFIGTPEMVGGVMKLAEGTTVDNIKNLLSFIVSRHQSLRTRIRVDADGTPKQWLSGSGEVPLTVIDVPDDGDPAAVAEATREHYETAPFNIAAEWPVRMAILRHNGVPSHFAVQYPHMVIDGYGFDALRRDLRNLDQQTGEVLGPRAGIQPLELARKQQTDAARRISDAALRYWGQLLRKVPPRQFRDSTDPRRPRYWDATYDSPAVRLAVNIIAARTRLHSGPIMMAAYAVAMSWATDIHPSAIRTLVSNRFRPDFGESVSVLVQPGLSLIDVANCTFDEAATRAWRAQLAAGKYGYYDPRDLWALMDRIAAQRGIEFDLMCYFNDRRQGMAGPAPGPAPIPDEVLTALPRSTLTWGVRSDNPDARAYLNVDATHDSINYTLRADTHALSPDDMVHVLQGMENMLVSSAVDPTATTTFDKSPAKIEVRDHGASSVNTKSGD
jgi:hypothetical protein